MLNTYSSAPLRLVFGLVLCLGTTLFSGDKKIPVQAAIRTTGHRLTIHFLATVHGEPLLLHKDYTNPFAEKFRIDIFRFYAGKINISFAGHPLQKIFSAADNHLVDFSDSLTTTISTSLPDGPYDALQIQLGVDSADQNGGAQTGALDPVKGMFWTWNSGYVGLKLEGSSPASKAPSHIFAYHLGGYRFPDSTWRALSFHATHQAETQILRKGPDYWEIRIELDRFFNGSTPVHIADLPACTTPGALASHIFYEFCDAIEGIEMTDRP